jgi:hypothetical protein
MSDALPRLKQLVPSLLPPLLALAIAGATGAALGASQARAEPTVAAPRDFDVAIYAGFLSSGERLYRSDAAYEEALRRYLSALNKLRVREGTEPVRQIYAAAKAFALIRLADLAEKRGASAESTRLTSDALAACATGGLWYCSSVELRQRARELDWQFERPR